MSIKLSPKRLYYVLVGCIVALALTALAGAVLGNRLLTTQNDKLTDLKLQRDVLEEQKSALIKAKADLERYAELENIAQQIVPQEKDQVRTVREIVNFASQSGINLGSIIFPGSELGTGTEDINLTQLIPVEGLKNVYQMEVTVTNASPTAFSRLVTFLQKLESNRRTSQVSTITITPNAENRNLLTFTITLNVYIKPGGGAS